jgi:hypothetical protein
MTGYFRHLLNLLPLIIFSARTYGFMPVNFAAQCQKITRLWKLPSLVCFFFSPFEIAVSIKLSAFSFQRIFLY